MRMGGQSREEKLSVFMPGAHLRTVLGHKKDSWEMHSDIGSV
jgi:hypothetical protein